MRLSDPVQGPLVFMRKTVFLILDIMGLACLVLSGLNMAQPLTPAALVLGSTLITIGLTLPIGLHYQLRHSSIHFKNIRSCEEAGIDTVFVSRDRDVYDLESAIDAAADRSSSGITFLGVGLPSLFDPSNPHTVRLGEKLGDYRTPLRVLLLDPDSSAAKRRQLIEYGSPTAMDIRETLNRGLPGVAVRRVQKLLGEDPDARSAICVPRREPSESPGDQAAALAKRIQFGVRLYDIEPILFLMGFDHCMFIEQYHLGRADAYVMPFGCIGRHVPVIQYARVSRAFAFFSQHFEFLWDNASSDHSEVIMRGLLSSPDKRKLMCG